MSETIVHRSGPHAGHELGLRHWLLQLLPPLILLVPLFTTGHGSAFVFILGFFTIPVLISFVSILIKLIRFRKRKFHLFRPTLTIGLFILLIGIANSTYDTALDEAIAAARIIHDQCNVDEICPENPEGWTRQGTRIRRNDFGKWFEYSASYAYQEAGFEMRVYKGPDLGHVIKGGVGGPFGMEPYREP